MESQEGLVRVGRAFISVYDKSGLTELVQGLHELGVEIISTGGTATAILEADVPAMLVESITGFPSIMEGRVKILHPAVFAGILADRSKPSHLRDAEAQGALLIDLVVVNYYDFEAVAKDPDCTSGQATEQIDIGGPSAVWAAVKNRQHVGVCVDPNDYPTLLKTLRSQDGCLSLLNRVELACSAATRSTRYRMDITDWLYTERTRLQQEAATAKS
jgi:phosphoribosylaminoimidazolecarboxamide formyltransferase/IMP cyclohydrolase